MDVVGEFLHLVKQNAGQERAGYRPFVYGHVASYDPGLHRVRCIVPSMRDDNGRPILSPWLPLGSTWVGAGFGFQVAPLGGATFNEPTSGEACLIEIVEGRYGAAVCATMLFNQTQTPPNTSLAAGEAIAKHQSGSFLYFHASGEIELNSSQDIVLTAARDVTITAGRNFTAEAMSAGGIARVAGNIMEIHAVAKYSWDIYGYGWIQTNDGSTNYPITNYVLGATAPSTDVDINPPDISG